MSIVHRLRQLGRAEWTARSASRAASATPEQLLKEARAELAGLAAEERRRRQRYQDALDKAAGYREQAEAWVRRGRDESATAFLRQESLTRQEAEGLRRSLDEVQTALEDLRRALRHAQETLQGEPVAAPTGAPTPPPPRDGVFRGIETVGAGSSPQVAERPPPPAAPSQDQAWPDPGPHAGHGGPPQGELHAGPHASAAHSIETPPATASASAWPDAPTPAPSAFSAVEEQLATLDSWQATLDRDEAEASLDSILRADSGGEDPELEARFRALEADRKLADLRRRAARDDGESEGGDGEEPRR